MDSVAWGAVGEPDPDVAEVAALYALMPEPKVVDTSRQLISPMPGLLKSVAVEVGQAVKAGETLAVVEAMKMENLLTAAVDGVVETIPATVGGTLRRDEVILTLEKGDRPSLPLPIMPIGILRGGDL